MTPRSPDPLAHALGAPPSLVVAPAACRACIDPGTGVSCGGVDAG